MSQGYQGYMGYGGGNQFNAPQSTEKKRLNNTEQSIRQLSINQVIVASQSQPSADSGWIVDGHELSQVHLVAKIVSITQTSTNTKYLIDDGTAEVEVTKWVESSEGDDASETQIHDEGTYIHVLGHLRDFKGRRGVQAYHIRPVTHPDQITLHGLQIIAIHLELTRGPPQGNQSRSMIPAANSNFHQSHVYDGGSSKLDQAISNFVLKYQTSDGCRIDDIISGLRGIASAPSIQKTISDMKEEGHLYESLDEHHVAVAE